MHGKVRTDDQRVDKLLPQQIRGHCRIHSAYLCIDPALWMGHPCDHMSPEVLT